jgi:predicted nucleic acid-binding protein
VTVAPQRVFIDASVLIAAAGSESGGSALVLEICGGSRYKALCSQRVLMEAQVNLRAKFSDDTLARFYRQLAALSPVIAPPATASDEAPYHDLATEKDAHVIASAVLGGAAYLISLDRRHLVNDNVRNSGLPFKVLLPGEFIRAVLSALP